MVPCLSSRIQGIIDEAIENWEFCVGLLDIGLYESVHKLRQFGILVL